MGCQDLLEEVPGRSRRDKDVLSSPGDLRSFVKGVTGRSSSKSYSVKDETSSKFFLSHKHHSVLLSIGITKSVLEYILKLDSGLSEC
jgi:protein kinase N